MTLTLTFQIFIFFGTNFKNSNTYLLWGWSTHPQLVGDWGKEDLKHNCHNHSLGLATKAKGLVRLRAKKKPQNYIACSGSVGNCGGMNPHIPKATPTLGNGIPVDF